MRAAIPYYTIEDLEQFPEDGNRYELLDGVLLVTPSPSRAHQIVMVRLATAITNALGDSAVVAASGVVLRDTNTQLEPDVLVDPPGMSLRAEWADVAEHWLAIEIFSPSSKIYDREFKRDAYLRLGVREVWLVDIDSEQIEVCTLFGSRVEKERVEWTAPHGTHRVVVELRDLLRD